MKTKEEAFEEYQNSQSEDMSGNEYMREDFSAGWDAATVNHDQEKEFSGSNLNTVGGNGVTITLGCISEDASDLLDNIMEGWEKQCMSLKEKDPKYKPSHYAFAYWLVRWSGLIQPSTALLTKLRQSK